MYEDITDQFIEVCRSITVDGWVSAEELWCLGTWLNEHPQALKVWPGNLFVEPLNRFFSDGVIEPHELQEAILLLARVERESAARQSSSEPVSDDEVPAKRSGRTRKATSAPPPIVVVFDWNQIGIPSLDLQERVQSFSGNGSYFVDLKEPSCTCPDWAERRSSLPWHHPAKACKHVVSVLCTYLQEDSVSISPVLMAILANAELRSAGVFPAERYGSVQIAGSQIVLTFNNNTTWVNVFAPNGDDYEKFGYNVEERRWAYGQRPKNSTPIAQAIAAAIRTL